MQRAHDLLSALAIALVMAVAIALPAVSRPSAVILLTGVAGAFALAGAASLVHLVVKDVRERLRAAPVTP